MLGFRIYTRNRDAYSDALLSLSFAFGHQRYLMARAPQSRLLAPAPSADVRPPNGDDWRHELKWDGFRILDGGRGRTWRLGRGAGAEPLGR